MEKHTRGPWRASQDPRGTTWFIQSRNVRHPNASHRWADVATVSYVNRCEQADAELMAAAPCMKLAIDAIRWKVGRIDGFEFCALGLRIQLDPYLQFDDGYYRDLEAEIEKAKGA